MMNSYYIQWKDSSPYPDRYSNSKTVIKHKTDRSNGLLYLIHEREYWKIHKDDWRGSIFPLDDGHYGFCKRLRLKEIKENNMEVKESLIYL